MNNQKVYRGTSLVVPWLRFHAPNAEGPGSIPGQGTRSHMPQIRVFLLYLKIPNVATKTQYSQNKKLIFLRKVIWGPVACWGLWWELRYQQKTWPIHPSSYNLRGLWFGEGERKYRGRTNHSATPRAWGVTRDGQATEGGGDMEGGGSRNRFPRKRRQVVPRRMSRVDKTVRRAKVTQKSGPGSGLSLCSLER